MWLIVQEPYHWHDATKGTAAESGTEAFEKSHSNQLPAKSHYLLMFLFFWKPKGTWGPIAPWSKTFHTRLILQVIYFYTSENTLLSQTCPTQATHDILQLHTVSSYKVLSLSHSTWDIPIALPPSWLSLKASGASSPLATQHLHWCLQPGRVTPAQDPALALRNWSLLVSQAWNGGVGLNGTIAISWGLNGANDQQDNVQSMEVSYLKNKRWKRKQMRWPL